MRRLPLELARAPRRNWRDFFALKPAFAGALAAGLLAIGIAVGVIASGPATWQRAGGTTTRAASVDTSWSREYCAGQPRHAPSDAAKNGGAQLRVTGMPQPGRPRRHQGPGEALEQGLAGLAVRGSPSDGTGTAAIPDALDGVDPILVTRERRGGSDLPTERPVVVVDL